MKKKETKNTKRKDALLWSGVAIVSLAASAVTYFLHMSSPIKVLVWLIWLVVCLALGFFTQKGKAIFAFIQEAKTELKKVVWPTRQETVQTTSIVMLMVGVTGIVLWGLDSLMMWVIGKITHLG